MYVCMYVCMYLHLLPYTYIVCIYTGTICIYVYINNCYQCILYYTILYDAYVPSFSSAEDDR